MTKSDSTGSAKWMKAGVASSLLGCGLVAVVMMWTPPLLVLQQTLVIWPNGCLREGRWLLLASILLLSGGSFRLLHQAAFTDTLTPRWRIWSRTLGPLTLLPLGAVAALLADQLPLVVVSNVLFFLPVGVAAMVVSRLIDGAQSAVPGVVRTRRWAWGILAGATVFFTALGIYLSTFAGEHMGDEGHYIIQAESLYCDGDLDIKNNELEPGKDLATVDLTYMHICDRSKDGHWYSWHPYGISVLLAPFWPGGMPLRQFILALMSAIGCVGMFLLSRRLGASVRSSLLALLFFCGSSYWALYSVRSLPEVLGATLLVWVFWAIAAQKEKPWVAVCVAAACCVYLPFAHFRFLPLSLMGFGLYGLFGLCATGSWGRKLSRLTAFTLLCLAGAAVYAEIQYKMFSSGASYSVSEVLFSYPLGAWAALADSRGVTAVLPVFMWMAAAWVVWLGVDKEHRWFALGIGATFAACLLTSCTNPCYTGGASVPGRYVLVVVPLLVPVAACMLDRASPLARGWFVFLGLISIAYLVVILGRLPDLGRSFVLPAQAVSHYELLRGLFIPHAQFISGTAEQCWTTSIYVGAGFLFTVLLLVCPSCRKPVSMAAFAVVLAAGMMAHRSAAGIEVSPYDAGFAAAELSKLDLDQAVVTRKDVTQRAALFKLSRMGFPDVRNPERRAMVTTKDLGERCVGQVLSQPRIEDNDWAGRRFHWTTLTAPFSVPQGQVAIHVRGRMIGTAAVVIAIRKGNHTLFEGPLPVHGGIVEGDFSASVRGQRGYVYLLVRLDSGDGEFRLEDLYWSPYSDRMLRDANLQLPEQTCIIRQ